MKTFGQFTEQLTEAAKTVAYRENGTTTDNNYGVSPDYRKNSVGWFTNKYNPGGWVICTLDAYDTEWVKEKGIDPKGVFRSFAAGNYSGNMIRTNLIQLNVKTGTYAFADSKHLDNTDELKFEKKTKFNRLMIDDNTRSKAALK